MTIKMIFMRPQPGVDRSGPDWDFGLVNFGLEVSDKLSAVDLVAGTPDEAKKEAERHWETVPNERFFDPAGYWVQDDAGNLVDSFERDEAAAPRAARDQARAEEFRRNFIAAGFALVPRREHDDDLQEPGPESDFFEPDDLVFDMRRKAWIERHPIARDAAAILRLIEHLAGPDHGTVGDLQRRWSGAAGMLAHLAIGGYSVDVSRFPPSP